MLKRISQKWNAEADSSRALVIWLGLGVAAATISDVGLVACGATVATAVVVALLPGRTPAMALLPVAVGVVLGLEMVPWAIAGAALASRPRPSGLASRLDGELQRQLMRSRRRDEPAQVLLVQVAGATASQLDGLIDAMRATDGLEVVPDGDACEIRAVLDGGDVDRAAVERRIWEVAPAAQPQFGWAAFPADGAALESLLATARASLDTGRGVPERLRVDLGVPTPSMAEANA